MDFYTKAVLTVIAGCLLILVGTQINYPSTAFAAGGGGTGVEKGRLVGATDSPDGWVYFMIENKVIYKCNKGKCATY